MPKHLKTDSIIVLASVSCQYGFSMNSTLNANKMSIVLASQYLICMFPMHNF